MKINGVWLPIITPFANGVIDYDSYEKMIDHYLSYDISGLIPLGTTGEIPVITDVEYEEIIERTVAAVADCIPVYVGLGGNYTDKLLKQLKKVEKYIHCWKKMIIKQHCLYGEELQILFHCCLKSQTRHL